MNVDVIWIENDYPFNSPFLRNKYIGLSKSFKAVLFHYGYKRGPNEVPNIRVPAAPLSLLLVLLIRIVFNPLSTLKFISVLKKRHRGKWLKKLILDAVFIGHKVKLIHFEFGTMALGRMYLGEALNCKILVSFRGYDINYFSLGKDSVFTEIWENASSLHFLGNDLRNRAIKRGCPEELNYCTISPAIDLNLFIKGEEYAWDSAINRVKQRGGIKLISVGRLVWKKGYEYAILAVKSLIDAGYQIEYRIIGQGNHKEAIEFMIRELGLQNHIKLLGGLSQKEIVTEMNTADVFLHPAISEGFCNAVIEAQALGLPVITTYADGLRENIEEGETGFAVPVCDYQLLAEKIEMFIQSPDLIKEFGSKGIRRAKTYYNLEDQISKFSNVYNQLING